jgi:3-methyladenine DNA glycosylase AlkC
MNKSELLVSLQTETSGFKHTQAIGDQLTTELGDKDALEFAKELFELDLYQARMCAVHIWGKLAAKHKHAYDLLVAKVVLDKNWRVQEMLAKAFDQYCVDRGYEESLTAIRDWLSAPEANQRRAASEGPRIWTSRPYFKNHPELAIELLAALRADPSEYVRKSVGNALRDISKRFPELIRSELQKWDTTDTPTLQTCKLAARFLA